MLQSLQHRRNVVPRLGVEPDLIHRDLTELKLTFLDFSHECDPSKSCLYEPINSQYDLNSTKYDESSPLNNRHSPFRFTELRGFLADTSYSEGLQNPELVILRLIAHTSGNRLMERQILRVLQTATGTEEIKLTSKGIRVSGPWGERMPLRDLADGYRSSFLWLTDLIGWALAFNPKRKSTEGIRGIVLIDEIEQHLHARWQRTVIDDLRKIFPNVQFIASTHSPLVASSVGPPLAKNVTDRLYVLEPYGTEGVKATEHEFMRGWRMDQVLASRAFKYQIEAAPSTEEMLRKVSSIGDAKERTPGEEELFQEIKKKLKHAFLTGTSPIERIAEIEAEEELMKRLAKLEEWHSREQ